jgi:hypothetical protein
MLICPVCKSEFQREAQNSACPCCGAVFGKAAWLPKEADLVRVSAQSESRAEKTLRALLAAPFGVPGAYFLFCGLGKGKLDGVYVVFGTICSLCAIGIFLAKRPGPLFATATAVLGPLALLSTCTAPW